MDGTSRPDPIEQARRLFLESRNLYGCAETTFIVLKTVYGLEDASDSAAAMALNGGVGYGGGICGAITGGALAVGLLAGRRLPDHRQAKRVAREVTARVMDEFAETHGAVDCRDLIGMDLRAPGGHSAFLRSGIWQDRCMGQVEFVIERLAPLADPEAWDRVVNRTGVSSDG